MPVLIDTAGVAREVPDDLVEAALGSGWTQESSAGRLSRVVDEVREDEYGGVGGAVVGGLAAFGRGISAGATDAAARFIGGDDAAIALEGYRDVNPGLSIAGEIGGALAPALLTGGTGALGALARATPAGAASVAGRAAGAAAGGGFRGALAAGAVEGGLQGVGAGVSELALSTDPLTLERAASVLSSNALFGAGVGGVAGAIAHPVERGLSRAASLLDERMAARQAASAVPGDLSTLDIKGLRAARGEEIERLANEQVATRAAARSTAVDDVIAYRGEVQKANPWLVIDEGEELAQLSKASKTLRLAIADDPKGLRENPISLLKPLRKEEQALEGAIARKAEIASALDEVDVKTAKEIGDRLRGPASLPDPVSLGRQLDESGDDWLEATVPARDIAARGYYEVPGAMTDPVRVEKARKAIREGQREPISLLMSKDGKIFVEGGRHRLAAAIELDAPIKVKWSTGVGPSTDDVLRGGTPADIDLTGRAARRYASFSGVKLPKDGTIRLERDAAAAFLDALGEGRVASDSRRALDSLDVLLERNRAMQAQLRDATAPLAPKSDLASPRLVEIDNATDVLRAPRQEAGLLEQAGRGAMFGAATGAVGAIPLIGQIPGVAHLIGAKAADTLTGLVFGRMGKAVSEVANRTAQAVKSFAAAVQSATPYVPVVATKVLQAVRYGARDDGEPDDLPALFKRRSDEVKQLTEYDETGTPRVRPEVRAQLFERLKPIAAVDPVAADRLETAAVRRIEHVSGLIPRQPDFGGLAMPDWQPSDMEMRAWARAVAAAEDPSGVEERATHGALSPEDVAAYWAVYPERAEDFKQSILAEMQTGRVALPLDRKLTLSMLVGQPLDPSLHPKVISVLQAQFPLEPGSAGGAQAPRTQPQFGSMSKLSDSAKTPAQERQS